MRRLSLMHIAVDLRLLLQPTRSATKRHWRYHGILRSGGAAWLHDRRLRAAESNCSACGRSRIDEAQRTPDVDDDVALAKEMVDAARKAAAQPTLSLSLARSAYKTVSNRTEGVEVAHEALQLIDTHSPQDRLQTRGDAVAIWTAAHRRAAGAEKVRTSAGLVAAMRWAAEAHAEAAQSHDAATLLQHASSLARISNHANAEQVREESDLAQHRQRAAMQPARLRQALLNSTNESAHAEQLARLLLIDLDTPHDTADLARLLMMLNVYTHGLSAEERFDVTEEMLDRIAMSPSQAVREQATITFR